MLKLGGGLEKDSSSYETWTVSEYEHNQEKYIIKRQKASQGINAI